ALRNANHCPAGVYIWPSPQSALVWDCVFFVHQGYYNNAVLKLRLMFPATYPAAPPAVHFATDVFHPLVSQRDGLFSLSPRFSDWSPSRHHVYDVLHFIKASFKKDTLKLKDTDCFNKEALRLYRENTSSFAALAAQSATLSQSKSALFDRDHPTLVGKGRDSVIFKETAPDALAKMRASLGLEEWTLGNFE
ncbi:ubiquitin-conjugating enzyme/RWD-like protein, partial [Auriculariales sp. MPI-PUGE-AT-0066]